MKKFIALTALAPLAFAVAILPAAAQETVVVKHRGEMHHHGHTKKIIIKKHHGHTTKIIKHSED